MEHSVYSDQPVASAGVTHIVRCLSWGFLGLVILGLEFCCLVELCMDWNGTGYITFPAFLFAKRWYIDLVVSLALTIPGVLSGLKSWRAYQKELSGDVYTRKSV